MRIGWEWKGSLVRIRRRRSASDMTSELLTRVRPLQLRLSRFSVFSRHRRPASHPPQTARWPFLLFHGPPRTSCFLHLVILTLLSCAWRGKPGFSSRSVWSSRARRDRGDRPWLFRGSRDDLRMITIHKHFEITRLRGMRPSCFDTLLERRRVLPWRSASRHELRSGNAYGGGCPWLRGAI